MDIACGENRTRNSVASERNTEAGDFFPAEDVHTSGAHVSYECGLGRRFTDGQGGYSMLG